MIVLRGENIILSVLKFDQWANHAFEMTYSQWKSTDPPMSPALMHILSDCFHEGSIGDITPPAAPPSHIY